MRILYHKRLITPPVYCMEYGLLYNWYALNDSRNIAASGWHLLTPTERNQLLLDLGGSSVAGGKMKETGIVHWDSPNTGATNESDFNFRGSGTRTAAGAFGNLNTQGWIWAYISSSRTAFYCESTSASVGSTTYDYKDGFNVRLVKDSTTLTNGQSGTYTGNDGRVYNTICISGVEYLADNLAETKFRNGDIIPWHGSNPNNFITNTEWSTATGPGCTSYNNDIGNVACDFTFPNSIFYGYIYNWFTVDDSRKITSSDSWIVPSHTDFSTLRQYLDPSGTDGTNTAGGKLKETGFLTWNTPNTSATNTTGFNGRGSGYRNPTTGVFAYLKDYCNYWCSTQHVGNGNVAYLAYNSNSFVVSNPPSNAVFSGKGAGNHIRLLKTSTTLSNGEYGTYTGNDGKVYRTVCIGTQEWLCEDLCETRYRNGDYIDGYNSGVYTTISNASWVAKTGSAMCAYSDDETNAIDSL